MANPREYYKHYIGISADQEKEMLADLGKKSLKDLYAHIDESNYMDEMSLPQSLELKDLEVHMKEIADKNNIALSFLGDGLQDFKIPGIVPKVCSIRGLTTAYTPYQPERSQGTLQTLWIYQSVISQITGFEAINASLYERSTCLYEALNCLKRMRRNSKAVIVANNIYPGDKEVLQTLQLETDLEIIYAPIDIKTSLIDQSKLKTLIRSRDDIAGFAFPQINCFGQIEDFNTLTDICTDNNIGCVGIFDPISLGNSGLKEPASWGSNNQGVNIIVGEGQHLTIAPNFGGPGLGIFGVRYNDQEKSTIRSTAGRYIGKSVDEFGKSCKSIILATREQHIRREKATSNICSNQSFIASACGAAILSKGSKGLDQSFVKAHRNALEMAQRLTSFEGVDLAFSGSFFNEICLKTSKDSNELITIATKAGLHIGVNTTSRIETEGNTILISFSDRHSENHLNELEDFFKTQFTKANKKALIKDIDISSKRLNKSNIPVFSEDELFNYYTKLGQQNLSPDDGLYPLGSCTMKYNPEINDWAASLDGFTQTHPQAPICDVQGNLEILYKTQEWFKEITGLPALTTQPVAGAQGELVGLKMFQAYHADKGEADQRKLIIIPRSAHGTNPATATMAGFENKIIDGKKYGIITIEALSNGEMDFDTLKTIVAEHSRRIAGIMVTNPNTAGIFETKFKQMSELIHSVGGLVYMDGANMNAIAGWIDLDKLGVDAVHNNLHKTWSIPHGGGGPGDAIVAVSSKLIDYLPGYQVIRNGDTFEFKRPSKSIGSFHRHHGNFAHKVRCYTYLAALGKEGIKRMSAIATLSACYLYNKLNQSFPILPIGSKINPRMHEFILTIDDDTFKKIADAGTPKAQAIAKIGKLFLDFGFHAPTVAFPEQYGLMIEPTESFTKEELDQFSEVVISILELIKSNPEVLTTSPHFTPVGKVDEIAANRTPNMRDIEINLDEIFEDKISAAMLRNYSNTKIKEVIIEAHKMKKSSGHA